MVSRLIGLVLGIAAIAAACGTGAPQSSPVEGPEAPAELAFADEQGGLPRTAFVANRATRERSLANAVDRPVTCPAGTTAAGVLDAARADGTWAIGDLIDTTRLSDGRELWVFGDTFTGPVDETGSLGDHRMVHSSAIVIDNGCVSPVATDDGWAWVSSPPDGTWLWPQGVIEADGLVYVFLVRVTADPDARPGLDFEVVGGALAAFDVDDLSHPLLVLDQPAGIGSAHPFGWAPVPVGDHVVVTAHAPDGTHLARMRSDTIATTEAWEYWNGSTWNTDLAASVSIHPGRLHLSAAPDGAVSAHTLGFGAATAVRWDAAEVTGPWSESERLALPDLDLDVEWAYLPVVIDETTLAHNVMPWDPSVIPDDVATYGPRFVDMD